MINWCRLPAHMCHFELRSVSGPGLSTAARPKFSSRRGETFKFSWDIKFSKTLVHFVFEWLVCSQGPDAEATERRVRGRGRVRRNETNPRRGLPTFRMVCLQLLSACCTNTFYLQDTLVLSCGCQCRLVCTGKFSWIVHAQYNL